LCDIEGGVKKKQICNLGSVLVESETGDVNLEGALFSIHLQEPPSTKAALFSLCQFYIIQALHSSSGGTNKPVLLTVLGLARDRTILIFPLPEVTIYDMLQILAVTVQMGHDISKSLKG
jgi:hypothetical protein